MRCDSICCHPSFFGLACSSVLLVQETGVDCCPCRVSLLFIITKISITHSVKSDTRVLLCYAKGGDVFAMTENHHADARVESQRLRRMMGSALIADSFGETRWMGALANTRWFVPSVPYDFASLTTLSSFSLGDLHYKKFGVTPEPEVRTKILESQYRLSSHMFAEIYILCRREMGFHGVRFRRRIFSRLG